MTIIKDLESFSFSVLFGTNRKCFKTKHSFSNKYNKSIRELI